MIKILAVGNSFSQDATAQIEVLSNEIFIRNLYYPSCSLGEHCYFIRENRKEYEYQHNGATCVPNKVSLEDALQFETWDYITIQQSSGNSGLKETYYPYIGQLIEYIKKYSNAKIIFHQTWTYEKKSEHSHFKMYEYNKDRMWNMIDKVTAEICLEQNLSMIKCGELIYRLGNDPLFDIDKNGLSLYRDTFHLNVNYGRFATACCWIKFFTHKIPDYLYREDLESEYKLIKTVLEKF